MGVGATNVSARVAASLGDDGPVSIDFKAGLDVPKAGVIVALPALLSMGLLRHTREHFEEFKGYYGLASFFLLLAYMALARVKSVEALRYEPPGEWGKILGLDRIPEARTLREKIKYLVKEGEPESWSSALCRDWMESFPEQATAFYIDGHFRVYHGHETKLPKHYVSREKLCLRGCADYWVNTMDGQPFFVTYQAIDPGLIQVLEQQILPQLEKDVPNQPTKEELENDPHLHRFSLIFDREGYSPRLMRDLKERRIACFTYRKSPGEKWPEDEFSSYEVKLVSGEITTMQLAERGTLLGSKKSEEVWVREVRRLGTFGHQTSIITTDYTSDLTRVCASMFARWCQENYFKYMKENFGLDKLVDYAKEKTPDTINAVNPEYKRIDSEVRSKSQILSRKKAKLGTLELTGPYAEGPYTFSLESAELFQEILELEECVDELKQKKKKTPRHIPFSELPEEQQFARLSTGGKHFLDTIKMVAYRAETAMVQILREKMARKDDVRALLRAIYRSEADLLPDLEAETLTIRLHRSANQATDKAVEFLLQELTDTQTIYPGTNLRIICELVS